MLTQITAGLSALLLIFTTSMATADDEQTYSGYLAEEVYGKLEKVEIREDETAERWLGPKMSLANYKAILIEPVILYPEPEPGPQVSEETLDEIRDYLTEKLTAKVGSVLNVADEASPTVLRMRTAVTGVEIKTEGMKAYEVVPVAAIFGGVKALTGKRDREVRVFVEVEFSDSVSGELVGAVVRRLKGENLEGKKDQLALEDVQPELDVATDDAQGIMKEMLGGE